MLGRNISESKFDVLRYDVCIYRVLFLLSQKHNPFQKPTKLWEIRVLNISCAMSMLTNFETYITEISNQIFKPIQICKPFQHTTTTFQETIHQ
ncbi:hypothetical protein L6452_20676 [Arctium lappa]|uniref:Uncharacterized protein n=1 Tax=Arctium lappa TaxID=4217 RepID=A0ACB9BCK4_ARCLA|nr:hypothetical protein L6452_20676 [Arctium lappa]